MGDFREWRQGKRGSVPALIPPDRLVIIVREACDRERLAGGHFPSLGTPRASEVD